MSRKRKKMKKQLHKIFQIPLGVWLLLLLFITLIAHSFAAFTNQGYRKGVATTSSALAMFSSNHLEAYAQETEIGSYTFSYTKQEPEPESVQAKFYIYNHAAENPTRPNPNNVNYTLTVNIDPLNSTGDLADGYKIALNDKAAESVLSSKENKFTSTLEGEILSQDIWTLTIPYSDLGKNKITIKAEPDAGCVLGDQKIGCIFQTVIRQEEQVDSFSWNESGVLLDRNSNSTDSQNYSAFNFEITGTGKGTGTLVWNPQYVELDKHFIDSNKLTITSPTIDGSTWKSVSLSLNSEIKNYYLLQFYRMTATDENENWDMISKKVKDETEETGYKATGYIRFSAVKAAE